MALFVGDPVKNLETSEVKELVALNPVTISTMPPTRSAREMSLFIMAFRGDGAFFAGAQSDWSSSLD